MQTEASTRDFQTPAPFTRHSIEANGLKLNYLDYGTAGRPPMLCIHGGAANAHWFDYVAPGFNADYHVRALDLRGHGGSEWIDPPAYTYKDYASDIAKVVEKLDLRDFVLMGHSMGGTVCLVYAATYPERIKNLIIIDSTVNLSAERIKAMRDVGTRTGTSYPTQEALVSRFKLRPGDSKAPASIVRYIATQSSREFEDGTWQHRFDRNVYATRDLFDGMQLWGQIKIPALIVKGSLSERISPEVVSMVKARAPHVEVVEVSNSGHHVTLDNPAEFVQKVKPFVDK